MTGLTLTRRGFLAGLAAASLARAAEPTMRRPNFLVIYTDDQRWDALGCVNAAIRTPAMDALAARGTRFANGFVPLSICSPSRACCLTGRYPLANGVTTVSHPRLNQGERTFAQEFGDAGYRTAAIGKWHLAQRPQQVGFQTHVTFQSNGKYFNRPVDDNGTPAVAEGYIEGYSVDRSLEFIGKAAGDDQPFVLWHCSQVPHMDHTFDWPARDETLATYDPATLPFPSTWQDELAGKPGYLATSRFRTQAKGYGYGTEAGIRRHVQRYYAVMTELDAALGRLLAGLDELGLTDDTYIFLMGDNGWHIGEHGFTSKVLAYETSMRVPFVVAGPGVKSQVSNSYALNVDIAPTMLAAAGMDVPKRIHGRPLQAVLAGAPPADWRSELYYEAPDEQLGSQPLWALRDDQWKYIRTEQPGRPVFEELYDLAGDRDELQNLAPDQPDRCRSMHERLLARRAEINAVA